MENIQNGEPTRYVLLGEPFTKTGLFEHDLTEKKVKTGFSFFNIYRMKILLGRGMVKANKQAVAYSSINLVR